MTVSSQPTEPSVPAELGSPSAGHPDSELSSTHKDLSQEETSIYSEDFDSESKLVGRSGERMPPVTFLKLLFRFVLSVAVWKLSLFEMFTLVLNNC